MTDANTIEAATAGLPAWANEMQENFDSVVDIVNAPADEAAHDPASVLPYLQVYVAQLPLADFESQDSVTLHTDLASFVAQVMIVQRGARWTVRPAPSAPRGYRYVLSTSTADGAEHDADPFDIIARELRNRPIEIARILATTELTLGAPAITN
jgi:hypothetical protein